MALKIIKRAAYLVFISLVGLLLTVFLLISPIAEYLIEKYSIEYTGRQINMDNLRINLINGVINADNLKVYETDNKNLFLGIAQLYVNTDLYSLISGENRIKEISLEMPVVNIKQAGETFNFDDLISRFNDTTAVADTTPSEPVKYLLQNLSVNMGVLNYSCSTPEVDASIIAFNVVCKEISHINPVIAINTDFAIKSGGKSRVAFNYNMENSDYGLDLDLSDFDIRLLFPYLRDYLFVESLDGFLSAKLDLHGNADNPADISTSGRIEVRDFSIIDTTSEKLAAVGAFQIDIDSINSGNDIYYFGNVLIDRPFVRFAMYDDGYNFDRIMVATESSDSSLVDAQAEMYANVFRMMADYIAYFTNEYKISNYKAASFKLTNGEIVYTDYTLENKFLYHLDSLQLHSENLNSANERLLVSLDAMMNTSGRMNGSLSVNPDGFSEMDIRYTVDGLLLSDINPYSLYYVATPFIDGRLFYENITSIRNKKLKSENKLRIEEITVGEKVENSTAMKLPVRLAVSLLKDLDGNINLSIPVVGDLDDPTYKWGRAVLQVLKNIVVKAAVAPFRLLAGMFGGSEEEYRELKMSFLQSTPNPAESGILENLYKALQAKPALVLGLTQHTNTEQETEMLALYKAKRDYLGIQAPDSLSSNDALRINAVSNRDSLFNVWVEKKIGVQSGLTSVQQKVIKIYGVENLKNEVHQLENARASALLDYFVAKGIDAGRIKISDNIIQDAAAAQTGPKFKLTYTVEGEEVPEDAGDAAAEGKMGEGE